MLISLSLNVVGVFLTFHGRLVVLEAARALSLAHSEDAATAHGMTV